MATSAQRSELDALQRRLIAEEVGVSPETVTPAFLKRILETRIYPSARLTIGSRYGGYRNTHLRVLTAAETAAILQRADARLAAAEAQETHK